MIVPFKKSSHWDFRIRFRSRSLLCLARAVNVVRRGFGLFSSSWSGSSGSEVKARKMNYMGEVRFGLQLARDWGRGKRHPMKKTMGKRLLSILSCLSHPTRKLSCRLAC